MERPGTITLHTERLILRPWQESDAESLYRYAQNPNVGPIAGWPPHTSVENSRAIIRTILVGDESYAIVLRETGEAIGSIGLITVSCDAQYVTISSDEREVGFWIGEPFWGRGLVPEALAELLRHAFEDLHLAAVWCGYYDGNRKSQRAQEKCGFTYHHTEPNQRVLPLNETRTEHFTRLTRAQWQERQQQHG